MRGEGNRGAVADQSMARKLSPRIFPGGLAHNSRLSVLEARAGAVDEVAKGHVSTWLEADTHATPPTFAMHLQP